MKKILYILSVIAVAAIGGYLFINAGANNPPIGHSSGQDTFNISGIIRDNRMIQVKDTFTTKSSDFIQLYRNSSKLSYFDSAARAYFPELLLATTTRTGEKLIVNGTADINGWKFGTSGAMHFPTNSFYADTSRQFGFYMSSIGGQPGHAKIYAVNTGSAARLVINLFRSGTQNQSFTFDDNGLTLGSINLTSTIYVPSIIVGANNTNEHSVKFLRSGISALGAAGFAAASDKYQINLGGNADLASGVECFNILRASGFTGIKTTTPTSQLHVTGPNGYTQFRLHNSYTPSATADANGAVGDVAWDDNYWYIKTSAGWKRAALSTF